jgi:hypothetical protein
MEQQKGDADCHCQYQQRLITPEKSNHAIQKRHDRSPSTVLAFYTNE